MLNFNHPINRNEDECFLVREVLITPKSPLSSFCNEHKFSYLVIIRMDDPAATAPVVTDIEIDAAPELDDWAFTGQVSEEEQERRINYRDEVYAQALAELREHYKVPAKKEVPCSSNEQLY